MAVTKERADYLAMGGLWLVAAGISGSIWISGVSPVFAAWMTGFLAACMSVCSWLIWRIYHKGPYRPGNRKNDQGTP
jgi:hypothetical protein